MESIGTHWREWRELFESRSQRPLPKVRHSRSYANLPESLAKSLAIFQLGESGGGTIIEQARNSRLPQIDEHYAVAMGLFVKEENRHADILALCVNKLGGKLIATNWTARLFVFSRRLIGLRLKVVVLLAAEVVGICYYHLLSRSLSPCHIKDLLGELVADEESHLQFHCDFLRRQASNKWRRALFVFTWRLTMLAAAVAVMIDHRAAIRDMRLGYKSVVRRWTTYSLLAEKLVVSPAIGPETTLHGGQQFWAKTRRHREH